MDIDGLLEEKEEKRVNNESVIRRMQVCEESVKEKMKKRRKDKKKEGKRAASQERVLSAARYHLKGNNSVNENNQMNLTVFVWLAKLKSKKRLLSFVSLSQRKKNFNLKRELNTVWYKFPTNRGMQVKIAKCFKLLNMFTCSFSCVED